MTIAEMNANQDKDPKIRKVSGFGEFPMAVDVTGTVSAGDVLIFPSSYEGKVKERVMGKDGEGKDRTAPFINLEAERGNTKVAVQLYVSQLYKNYLEYRMNGATAEFVASHANGGTAVDLVLGERNNGSGHDLADGMNKLLGKRVKVSLLKTIQERKYRNGQPINELRPRNIYSFDVEAQKSYTPI